MQNRNIICGDYVIVISTNGIEIFAVGGEGSPLVSNCTLQYAYAWVDAKNKEANQ